MVRKFTANIANYIKSKLESTASNIKMNGTQSAGTSENIARADHVHPTDTSRAASSHTHGNITNDGAIGSTANKPIITTTSGKLTAGNFESTATNIKMNGTQAVGTKNTFARGDHVHPTDTSRASTDVATASANGLMSSTDKDKFDKSLVVGQANASGTTSAFTASITGVTLTHGTIIALYNAIGNNAASATLNVNGLGAKPIYYKASAISASTFPNNCVCLFMYNTSIISTGCWQLIYSYDSNTTYTASTLKDPNAHINAINTAANAYQTAINTALDEAIASVDEKCDNIVAGDIDLSSTHTHTKSQITDFPSSMTPSSHTHGNLQNDGKVGTSDNASKNVVTDANGKITTEAKPTIPSANTTATNIKMNGTQSAGSASTFAKADHVHPTDTSRAAVSHSHTKSQITDLIEASSSSNGLMSKEDKDTFDKSQYGVMVTGVGTVPKPYLRILRLLTEIGSSKTATLMFEFIQISSGHRRYGKFLVTLRRSTETTMAYYVHPIVTNNLINEKLYFAFNKTTDSCYLDIYYQTSIWDTFVTKIVDYHKIGGDYILFSPKANGTEEAYTDMEEATTINGPYDGGIVNNVDYTVTANKIIKSGGTSSQFLKADGSVDDNFYITSDSLSDGTGPDIPVSKIIDTTSYLNIENSEQNQAAINTAIDNKLGALSNIELVEVVGTLPTASSSTMNKLYLVAESSSATNDNYQIFITVKSGSTYSWEKVDTARIDLGGKANVVHTHEGKDITITKSLSGEDLNLDNITTQGLYTCTSANSENLLNKPFIGKCPCLIENKNYTNNTLVQTVYTITAPTMTVYIRSRNNSQWSKWKHVAGTEINEISTTISNNLKEYKQEGLYTCSRTTSSSILDKPFEDSRVFFVYNMDYKDSTILAQIVLSISATSQKNRIYYRFLYSKDENENDKWTSWFSLATLDDIPTKVSDLINDSNFISEVTIEKLADAVYDTTHGGTIGSKLVPTNDSRLSDARTPTSHTDSSGAYGKATTSVYGHTKLSSATNSEDETLAATPKAVKAAYDLANSKPSLGTTSTTAATGNHTHRKSEITDFPTSMTPASHASSATTYGVGTTSNYGHNKLVTNLTTDDGNGLALGAGQGKALKALIDAKYGKKNPTILTYSSLNGNWSGTVKVAIKNGWALITGIDVKCSTTSNDYEALLSSNAFVPQTDFHVYATGSPSSNYDAALFRVNANGQLEGKCFVANEICEFTIMIPVSD